MKTTNNENNQSTNSNAIGKISKFLWLDMEMTGTGPGKRSYYRSRRYRH